MILIAHRGNTHGPNPKKENRPSYIREALNKYGVEIDIWLEDDQWWLGHDKPQYKCDEYFLWTTPGLWVHCKNDAALVEMSIRRINQQSTPVFFWHDVDTHVLTSHPAVIWTYPGKPLTELSICVLPEKANYKKSQLKKCLGICSDYIYKYKKL